VRCGEGTETPFLPRVDLVERKETRDVIVVGHQNEVNMQKVPTNIFCFIGEVELIYS
jgi:hypothetical protein